MPLAKIDITISDALKRKHQCATIQLDFQLPQRFELQYMAGGSAGGENDYARPVIIHRAILGSVERMIAILTESFGGKWPFWLSPRQACVIPVRPQLDGYAEKVRQFLHDKGFMVEVDVDTGTTLNKKIRNAQLAQFNFILVVGNEEEDNNTVNVRTRDNEVHGWCFWGRRGGGASLLFGEEGPTLMLVGVAILFHRPGLAGGNGGAHGRAACEPRADKQLWPCQGFRGKRCGRARCCCWRCCCRCRCRCWPVWGACHHHLKREKGRVPAVVSAAASENCDDVLHNVCCRVVHSRVSYSQG